MATVTDQEWSEFKEKFNKNYSEEEDGMRREAFAKSKAKVEEHNKKYKNGEVSYNMAINHLSDCTPEEMARRCGKRIAAQNPSTTQ